MSEMARAKCTLHLQLTIQDYSHYTTLLHSILVNIDIFPKPGPVCPPRSSAKIQVALTRRGASIRFQRDINQQRQTHGRIQVKILLVENAGWF